MNTENTHPDESNEGRGNPGWNADGIVRELRNVDVPDDLVKRLKSIPELTPVQSDVESYVPVKPACDVTQRASPLHWSIAVVALVASLVAFVTLAGWLVRKPSSAGPFAGTFQTGGEHADESGSDTDIDDSIAELEMTIAAIETHMLRQETAMLEERLARARTTARSSLSPREIDSMIVAIAAQSGESFGASRESVSQNLLLVITQHPGSRGADMAREFLNQQDD